ncbi:hypothetical protein SNEBB_006519 [Seison nebaliae]|nr:hypothetical protein SNEBB_006519 [Seison nebaliae]
MQLVKLSKYLKHSNFHQSNASNLTSSIEMLMEQNAYLLPNKLKGTFHYLPFGERCLEKISNIIDQHLFKVGAMKIRLSSLIDQQSLNRSNRLEMMKDDLIYCDNSSKSMKTLLCPTHEESICQLLSSQLKRMSPRNFPLNFYQIGNKYRYEKHPKNGLLRSREFLMKDLYTFALDQQSNKEEYEKFKRIYQDIFQEFQLNYIIVSADNGSFGGDFSHEFHIINEENGEDEILLCKKCNTGVNRELFQEDNNESMKICSDCQNENLVIRKSTEIAHIFHLGKKFTKLYKLKVPQKNEFLEMSCYGIGISRLFHLLIKQHQKRSNEINLPFSIAPFNFALIMPQANQSNDCMKHFQTFIENMSEKTFSKVSEKFGHSKFDNTILIDDENHLKISQRINNLRNYGISYTFLFPPSAIRKKKVEVLDNSSGEISFISFDQ